ANTEAPTMRYPLLILAVATAAATAALAAAPRPEPAPRPRLHRHDHADAAAWRDPREGFAVTAAERREETYRLPANGKVVVDDVAGDIRVRAIDGDAVHLVAVASLHARSTADLELARREMPLQLSQHGDTVIAFVDS